MILYLTYNDTPSGIYSSQVIDVVKFLRYDLSETIKLVAYISVRNFFSSRRKIKNELKDAIVVPMVPGISRWAYNQISLWFICLILQPRILIGRSVLATHLALKNKKKGRKIIYDGRGAIGAEWHEYKVVEDKELLNQIGEMEKEAIYNSDFRIAVSKKLVEYWSQEFGYNQNQHVIIPCTLNKFFEKVHLSIVKILEQRTKLGFKPDDIVLAYSGSVAGWQSFELLYKFLSPLLGTNSNLKILFLADKDKNIKQLEKEFPGKIYCEKISPSEVPSYLIAADYGLLIREKSITNKVASPVKFAEYLACGLPVIISHDLGDYSSFVGRTKSVLAMENLVLENISLESKKEIRDLHLNYFLKNNYNLEYKALINI